MLEEETPYPGSDEARAINCICPVMDNARGIGGMLQTPVIRGDCPVHADEFKAMRDAEEPS